MNISRLPRIFKLSNTAKNYVNKSFRCSSGAVLGIETSCDDTGCAIIDSNGKLLGEALHSQNLMHLRNGGIIPDIAQDLHRTHIEPVVNQALNSANLTIDDLSAIAVTLEPGLALSLVIGMKYAKHLARKHNKPLIPIHHMEAHALAVRMQYDVSFPYLVLLISGGHCLLAVVNDVNDFLLLGESIDIAPGEMFDKVARRLKLRNVPEYSKICGGQAIELAASKAENPNKFNLKLPLVEYRDCNFSFNGLKTGVFGHIYKSEKKHEAVADWLIPEVNDLCAAMLRTTSKHLIHKTQRAIEYCNIHKLLPKTNRHLVVSGGVACNNYIFNALKLMCEELDFKILRPEPKLCTDNGVMIAWNGFEKLRRNIHVTKNLNKLDIKPASPLGKNLIPLVKELQIPMKLMKLKI